MRRNRLARGDAVNPSFLTVDAERPCAYNSTSSEAQSETLFTRPTTIIHIASITIAVP